MTLQAYEKHDALRDIGFEKIICLYLKVSIMFCSIVKPQKSYVCTWVTVYRITLKWNLWKDTQYLMFQCRNEINYWHIIYEAFPN